jgi:hypothetical protein
MDRASIQRFKEFKIGIENLWYWVRICWYRKTPLLVQGLDPFSNANTFLFKYHKVSRTTPWRKIQKTFLYHGINYFYGHF